MTASVLIEEKLLEKLAAAIQAKEIEELLIHKIPLYFTRAQVGRLNGLKMEIFSDEHPPPHFRVSYQGGSANYEISSCRLLCGDKQVTRRTGEIYNWWLGHKQVLVDKWNALRPTDCQVGNFRQ